MDEKTNAFMQAVNDLATTLATTGKAEIYLAGMDALIGKDYEKAFSLFDSLDVETHQKAAKVFETLQQVPKEIRHNLHKNLSTTPGN